MSNRWRVCQVVGLMFCPLKPSGSMLVVLAQPLPIFGGMELILPVLIIIGMVPTIQEVIFVKLEMSASTVLIPLGIRASGRPHVNRNSWSFN